MARFYLANKVCSFVFSHSLTFYRLIKCGVVPDFTARTWENFTVLIVVQSTGLPTKDKIYKKTKNSKKYDDLKLPFRFLHLPENYDGLLND